MGLNEGVNTFVDENGVPQDRSIYMPAYLRRYPFMLAKLRPDSDELSLCFDPTSGAVGDFEEGQALFDGDQPSEATNAVLNFCEQFETAVSRTRAFMEELQKLEVIIDGEVALQQEGMEQPAVYRGFRMVSEDKLRELRGDQLRKIVQNGMMGLIYAHLFSLANVRELFAKQMLAAAA